MGADVHADEGPALPFQESEHVKPALLFELRSGSDPIEPNDPEAIRNMYATE
jgi:hypothetical protein